MTALRALAVAVLVMTGLVVQPNVINTGSWPVGVPQLPLLILAIIAIVEGSGVGAIAGFATGLVSDAISTHPLGEQALVLTLVGWFAGSIRDDTDRSVLLPVVTVLGATATGLVACAALGFLVAGTGVAPGILARETIAAVAYAGLLAPLLLPPLRSLLVRLDPERQL